MKDHKSIIDEAHNIVWANDGAGQIFGSDIVGKKCYTVYQSRNMPCEECVVRQTFADGKVHKHKKMEFIGIDGNKMTLCCRAGVVARCEDGRPEWVAAICCGCTKRE